MLECGLHSLPAASTAAGRLVLTSLKISWSEVHRKALEDILVDTATTCGCVWLFVLPKLVFRLSTEAGSSVLSKLKLLLTGNFLRVRTDSVLLMELNRTSSQTTKLSRCHKWGHVSQLADQGRLKGFF